MHNIYPLINEGASLLKTTSEKYIIVIVQYIYIVPIYIIVIYFFSYRKTEACFGMRPREEKKYDSDLDLKVNIT